MNLKRLVAIIMIVVMMINTVFVVFADPTTDFHKGLLPGEKDPNAPTGPEVAEYYVYDEEKKYTPGSLLGDVDLNTVGKGLFYDGNDFYLYIDTGVMVTNYMFTIEGDRFFFGEDGKMVKNQLVSYNDQLYYFDVNGAMFKNRWYSDEAIDESDNKLVYTDYYFGPTGRAYKAPEGGTGIIVKTIEGQKYGFNTDGEKLEGYYDQNGQELDPSQDAAYADCVYYFDPEENGAATTGWHYYEGSIRGDGYEDNEEIVLYFDEKTCKKVAAKSSYADQGRCISRIIGGQRYMFDSNGVRRNKWYDSEPLRGTRSNTKYFSEENDSYLTKGWFLAVPGSYAAEGNDLVLDVNKKRHNDDEDVWFYAGRNGNILKKTIRKIGNYVYAFDDDGVMQSDAFVKVKNGAFIKAYSTDYLTRANVLFDPIEYGGNADPYSDDYTKDAGDNLIADKGILKANEGEQWMYFLGLFESESQEGALARQNTEIKISLKDKDIFFIQNSTGGYTKHTNVSGKGDIATVVERSNQYIQNGVVLRPDPDDNSYGIVRTDVNEVVWREGSFINYKNQALDLTGEKRYIFQVVNSKGNPIKAHNRTYKDKNGMYIYVGPYGEFIGLYGYDGRYYTRTPSNLVDEDGNPVPSSTKPCWAYKKQGEKKWIYGLPPEAERQDASNLFLNFGKNSELVSGDHGPYTDGLAKWIYTEAE